MVGRTHSKKPSRPLAGVNGTGSALDNTNPYGPENQGSSVFATQSVIVALPTMPPKSRRSLEGIRMLTFANSERNQSKSGSNALPACISISPLMLVLQVLFSIVLCPLTISHAHGCLIDKVFIQQV